MTGQKQFTQRADELEESLESWLAQTHEIVHSAGQAMALADGPITLEVAKEMLSTFRRKVIDVAIVGSPNTGKSSLANQLIGRSLLPMNAISSAPVAYIQYGDRAGKEGFIADGDRATFHPLENLQNSQIATSAASVVIALHNDWLENNRLRLIKTAPLDVDGDQIEVELVSLAKSADCFLLVTDALASMKRHEARAVSDCSQRGIPMVVVVSKVDRLQSEDYDTTLAYVDKFAKACSTKVQVIPFSDRHAATQGDIAAIKDGISEAIQAADVADVRARRLAVVLINILEDLLSVLKMQAEQQREGQRERDVQLTQQQQSVAMQTLDWQRIKHQLAVRRQKVDEKLRAQLQTNHATILNDLLYELDSSADFREWWRRDFPAALAQSVQITADQMTQTINDQAIVDIEWLQAEAHRKFEFPLEDFNEPRAAVNAVPAPPNSLQVSDQNVSDLISRVGAAAAAVLARVLATTFKVSSPEIVANAVAGIATEQLINYNATQEKEKLRGELNAVIQKVQRAYAAEATRQLEESYCQIVADLQHQQSRWETEQSEVLKRVGQAPDGSSTSEINQRIEQALQLKKEIQTIL